MAHAYGRYGPRRGRQYRWFHWSRNAGVAVTYPLAAAVAVGVAGSSYGSPSSRLITVSAVVAALGLGLLGFFMNVGLRRQADAAGAASRPVIFMSAVRLPSSGADSEVRGKGWLEVLGGRLVFTFVGTGRGAATWSIPLASIERIERRVLSHGAYPRLAIKAGVAELVIELPPQTGLTFTGISDRDFRRVLDSLRAAFRQCETPRSG